MNGRESQTSYSMPKGLPSTTLTRATSPAHLHQRRGGGLELELPEDGLRVAARELQRRLPVEALRGDVRRVVDQLPRDLAVPCAWQARSTRPWTTAYCTLRKHNNT